MGERASRRYFTTAERFGATEAHRLGLLSEVVAQEDLDGAIENLIEALLGNGPQAVRAAKALIVTVAGRELEPQLIEETCEQIARIRVSQEGQEGLGAFLNKRKPHWLAQ